MKDLLNSKVAEAIMFPKSNPYLVHDTEWFVDRLPLMA